MTAGAALHRWRKRNGLSQIDLARRIGTHQPQIFLFEKDMAVPTLQMAVRIAKLTGIRERRWVSGE